LCLPAVFMPYKSPNNIFNPRAHQYFHPSGSNIARMTQPPSMFQLPAIPHESTVSVINLFELGQRHQYLQQQQQHQQQYQQQQQQHQQQQQRKTPTNMFSVESSTNL
jgi:hypothetical protein